MYLRWMSCFIGICASTLFAQNINITGKVLGSDGKPVAAAEVKLLKSNLIDTTDDNGDFTLTNGAACLRQSEMAHGQTDFHWEHKGNLLVLHRTARPVTGGTMQLIGINGKAVWTGCFGPTEEKWSVPVNLFSDGVYILSVSNTSAKYSFMFQKTGLGMTISQASNERKNARGAGLEKSHAAPDTIVISKQGYATRYVAIIDLKSALGNLTVPVIGWQKMAFNPKWKLHDLHVASGSYGWISSNIDTMLTTSNGGFEWKKIRTKHAGTTATVYLRSGIFFLDSAHGWGLDGENAYFSSDKGENWTSQVFTNGSEIFFSDTGNGWIVNGRSDFYHTANGGTTWGSAKSYSTEYFNIFSDVYSRGRDSAWFVGGYLGGTVRIFFTADSGNTYTVQYVDTSNGMLNGVTFVGASGWSCGAKGKMLYTSNNGQQWTNQNSGTTASLSDVAFYNSQIGCAVGDSGVVVETSDGGVTWKKAAQITPRHLSSVSYFQGGALFAVGDSGTVLCKY